MAWVTPVALAVSALASGAAGMASAGRSQAGIAEQNRISQEQLDAQKTNALQQQIVQAMINQRAVAGTQDSFGSSMRYDPATNTWISELGPLPQAADRAAMQAGIQANTVDPARVRLANEVAMRAAAEAQPYADQTRRDLQSFRPMGQDQLIGLLTNQATTAARATYDPLRNDVLRGVQRTGTAAGPVLSELGRGEAANLRNALRDAMITGMTTTDQINQGRRSSLENAAANARTLATPNLQNPNITGSAQGNTLASLMQQRSTNAPSSTAQGMYGANLASAGMNAGYNNVLSHMTDPNFGLNQTISGLKDIGTLFGKGGAGQEFLKSVGGWFSGNDNSGYTDTERTAAANWGD